jgi:hypothetical protein
MKKISVLMVLVAMSFQSFAHAESDGSTAYSTMESALATQVQSTIDQYQIVRTNLTAAQDAVRDLKAQRDAKTKELEQLKANRSALAKTFKKANKEMKKLGGEKLDPLVVLGAADAKMAEIKFEISDLDAKMTSASTTLDRANSSAMSQTAFDKQMQKYRDQYSVIAKTEEQRAKLTSLTTKTEVKPAVADATLAANLKKNALSVMKDAQDAKVAAVEKAANVASCAQSVQEIAKLKDSFSKGLTGESDDASSVCKKATTAVDAGFASAQNTCGSLTVADNASFSSVFADSSAPSATTKVSELLEKSKASLSQSIAAKCEKGAQVVSNLKAVDSDVCTAVEKDQIMNAMVTGTLKQNPEALTDMFEVATLKMAYAMQKAGAEKASLEASINKLVHARAENGSIKANQKTKQEILSLYDTYGRADDRQKILTLANNSRYGNIKTRLTNDNASSLMLLLRKPADATLEPTDFTDVDVAAVWAVEKVRRFEEEIDNADARSKGIKPVSEFAIGKREGNLLNFSTKVYALANPEAVGRKLASSQDFAADMSKWNEKIDAAINHAFADLTANQKACFLKDEKNADGKSCQLADGLGAGQMKSVREMIARLADRAHYTEAPSAAALGASAVIDPTMSVSDNGQISLNWDNGNREPIAPVNVAPKTDSKIQVTGDQGQYD